MRPRGLFAGVVLLMLAVACTGGGSGRAAVTPSPGAAAPLVYAALGASETAGVGTADPIEDAWPRVLWRTLPPGSALYDFGVGGSTTRQALVEQVNAALSVRADVATVWFNVNDLLHGVTPDRYGRQLRVVVHDLLRDGETIVLVANTPRLDTLPVYLACRSSSGSYVAPLGNVVECPADLSIVTPSPRAVRAAVAAYNREIETIVEEEGAVLVDLHALGDIPTERPELVSDDGFHPSTDGARVVASAFETALEATGVIASS